MKYLFVDDQVPQQEDIIKKIKLRMLDAALPLVFNTIADFEEAAKKPETFDQVLYALIDLELGEEPGEGQVDYLGRDIVLPRLREVAPWIPAICVSQYLQSPEALHRISASGFDALIAKTFFHSKANTELQWTTLMRAAQLARIGSLTGRDPWSLERRLVQLPQIDEPPASIKEAIVRAGEERFRSFLALLVPPCERIIFDEITAGFSGLQVIRMHCCKGSARSTWLLKWGPEVRKLHKEVTAHRHMFEEGFTRDYSVPLLWWSVIHWEGLGGIAYEFAESSRSLVDYLADKKPTDLASILVPVLERLHRGSVKSFHKASPLLLGLLSNVQRQGRRDEWGPVVQALLAGEPAPGLSNGFDLVRGPQHGDFHARNIMVTPGGSPVLIDFVHYRGHLDGVPLLDLAKLLVDLAANHPAFLNTTALLSGDIFAEQAMAALLRPALAGRDKLDTSEAFFWRAAISCLLAEYTTYPDLILERRTHFLEVLRA